MELSFYTSLIDIHRDVNTYCVDLWNPNGSVFRITNFEKSKILSCTGSKSQLFNRKDEVILNRLQISHLNMSYGQVM